jgi:8-oxo-dGTP pyrophosphatase MutT (NUDIX family)
MTADATARLLASLAAFQPLTDEEARDVIRLRQLAVSPDPWSRAAPLHATASAIIVDPAAKRVLLRWHDRMRSWLQVGGHADPGETDPFTVALREAGEETGLGDLEPWPDSTRATVVQVAIVPVPAGKGEPAHHHADIRYLLATARPQAVSPESEHAELVWLDVPDALARVGEDNLRVCLRRVEALFARRAP